MDLYVSIRYDALGAAVGLKIKLERCSFVIYGDIMSAEFLQLFRSKDTALSSLHAGTRTTVHNYKESSKFENWAGYKKMASLWLPAEAVAVVDKIVVSIQTGKPVSDPNIEVEKYTCKIAD